MTTDETVDAPDVVTGTFLVNASLARVLFDSGENRSFVSPNLARTLHLSPSRLEFEIEVEVVDDRQVCVREGLSGSIPG